MSTLTGGPVSAVSAVGYSQRVDVVDDHSTEAKKKGAGPEAFGEIGIPSQPLSSAADGMTAQDLFRMMRKACEQIRDAAGEGQKGTAEEKKKLADVQAENRMKEIQERADKVAEQMEAQKASDTLGWVMMGVGILLAGVMAVLTCGVATGLVVAVVVAGLSVAAHYSGEIVEALAPASASPEAKAAWAMALGIGLSLVAAFMPPNPGSVLRSVAGAARTVTATAIRVMKTVVKMTAKMSLKSLGKGGAKVFSKLGDEFLMVMKAGYKTAKVVGQQAFAQLRALAKTMAGKVSKMMKKAGERIETFFKELLAVVKKIAKAIKGGSLKEAKSFMKGLGKKMGQKLDDLQSGFKQSCAKFRNTLKNLRSEDSALRKEAREQMLRYVQRGSSAITAGGGVAQGALAMRQAELEKELEQGKARHQALDAIIENCLEMLDKQLPYLTRLLEACSSFGEAEREFAQGQHRVASA